MLATGDLRGIVEQIQLMGLPVCIIAVSNGVKIHRKIIRWDKKADALYDFVRDAGPGQEVVVVPYCCT